jgi:hypothetical protein
MVHNGHACVGHIFSKDFSTVDVLNPRKPRRPP